MVLPSVVSWHALPVVVPSLHMSADITHHMSEGKKKSRKKKNEKQFQKALGCC